MKSVRKYGAALVAALLLGSFVQSTSAEAGAKIPSTVPYFGLYLNESFDLNLEPDNFYANANNPDHSKILRCSSVDDEICTQSTSVMVIHQLPACSIDSSFDCIKSVWAIDSSGKKIEGQFQTSLPVKGTTDKPAIPSMLLSATNGFGGLWKIPGATNGGGEDNYFVSMRISSWNEKAAGVPLSCTRPWCMKITRSATLRAKFISCVTISSVMPSSASVSTTRSTSPTSSPPRSRIPGSRSRTAAWDRSRAGRRSAPPVRSGRALAFCL